MGKDRNGTPLSEKRRKHEEVEEGDKVKEERKPRSKSTPESDVGRGSDSETDRKPKRSEKAKKSRSRYSSDEYSDSDSESDSDESEYSDSGSSSEESMSESEDEEERRRRKRRERKRRREREEERERKRRKREKEKKKRKEEKRKREKEKRKKKERKKKEERGKKGAVTNSWGKYGIIRETDMWNKRPEFTAWLAEVKQVNLENLANWEEKQMFKDFMEDHNTATFPSKKYYNLDAHFRHKLEKEIKKGPKKSVETERTIFDDEEQRRLELLKEREKQKEQQVEELKRSMQGGMAQAMKEQAQLKEEMAYQYKLGNFEAAAAIQRRLDPDVAM
ncbi:DEAD-box ATP-dependent RNA helicase 42 [Tripterygium wilfordii]|uniref:DEAD-box ATP-dependent RNA helicase 42 n=1 Tax=Tripterygium wilfordii TaxID=458696 RepID=A0A7J7C2D1_TRIWF|nr:vicilin-like seed storage protein At2g18540 [Tripterygium wilfordii]KAF5728319.1 DEAD-box ATP-dependent RNA helicase 42 [Tripterygium wilfordii]